MKKYGKILIIAICIGGILAFIFYKDIKSDVLALTSNDDTVYLFQVGVYENINNANKKLEEYSGNIMIYYDNYYRVLSGICYSDDTCEVIKNYFDNISIKYYLKKFKVDNKMINEIKYYESIINNTNNTKVMDSIISKINTLFKDYLT